MGAADTPSFSSSLQFEGLRVETAIRAGCSPDTCPAAPGTRPPPPAPIITAPPQVTGLHLPPSELGRGAQRPPTSALGGQGEDGTATPRATLCPQNKPSLQKRWNLPKGPRWGRGQAGAPGEVCPQSLLLFHEARLLPLLLPRGRPDSSAWYLEPGPFGFLFVCSFSVLSFIEMIDR